MLNFIFYKKKSAYSKVLVKGESSFKLDDFSQNTKTIHYFGYFSLVGLLRIYVLVGKYDLAMKII